MTIEGSRKVNLIHVLLSNERERERERDREKERISCQMENHKEKVRRITTQKEKSYLFQVIFVVAEENIQFITQQQTSYPRGRISLFVGDLFSLKFIDFLLIPIQFSCDDDKGNLTNSLTLQFLHQNCVKRKTPKIPPPSLEIVYSITS